MMYSNCDKLFYREPVHHDHGWDSGDCAPPTPTYFGDLLYRLFAVKIDLECVIPPTFEQRTSEDAYMGVLQDSAGNVVRSFCGETPSSVREQAKQWAETHETVDDSILVASR